MSTRSKGSSFAGRDWSGIRNSATPGANTFKDNVCLTSVNAPCPAFGDHSGADGHEEGNDKQRKKQN